MIRVETVAHVCVHYRSPTWFWRIRNLFLRPQRPRVDMPPEYLHLPPIKIAIGEVRLPRATR